MYIGNPSYFEFALRQTRARTINKDTPVFILQEEGDKIYIMDAVADMLRDKICNK